MADNTFNFDLDAPAVPTLTLDPTPAEEEKAAPAQQEAAAVRGLVGHDALVLAAAQRLADLAGELGALAGRQLRQ